MNLTKLLENLRRARQDRRRLPVVQCDQIGGCDYVSRAVASGEAHEMVGRHYREFICKTSYSAGCELNQPKRQAS